MQLDVRRALATHFNDARAVARKRPLECRAKRRQVADPLVCEPVERGGLGKVQSRGGGDVARVDVRLVIGARCPRALRGRRAVALVPSPRARSGRKSKIPPPRLSSSTIVSFRPSRRAASRPPMSWARATSPIRSTTGPSPAAAAPKALETVPSMPLAPRLHSTRGGSGADRPERLDVAHRHRGGDEQGRRLRQQHPQLGREGGSDRRPLPASVARIASAASSSALRQLAPASRRPRRVGLAAGDVSGSRDRARRGRARARASRESTQAGSCQAPSGSSATWRTSCKPRKPRAQRLGDRQVADAQDEVGRGAGGKRLVAQQRVVVGDRGIPAAGARQRVGQQRPAARRAERRRSPRRAGRPRRRARGARRPRNPAPGSRDQLLQRVAPSGRAPRDPPWQARARGARRRAARSDRRAADRRRRAARAAGSSGARPRAVPSRAVQ